MDPGMLHYAEQAFDPSSDFHQLLQVIKQLSKLTSIGCYEFMTVYGFVEQKLGQPNWSMTQNDKLYYLLAEQLDITPYQAKIAVQLCCRLQE